MNHNLSQDTAVFTDERDVLNDYLQGIYPSFGDTPCPSPDGSLTIPSIEYLPTIHLIRTRSHNVLDEGASISKLFDPNSIH